MIAKIFLLSVLIAGISMSIASPVPREEEIPEYIEVTVPEEMNLTAAEDQGNGSNLNMSVYGQSHPSRYEYLRVTVKYARGLRDTDGWWNLPDPYAVVSAYKYEGGRITRYTRYTHTVGGTVNPNWYTTFEFSWSRWYAFQIRVWDNDVGWDDAMTSTLTVYTSPGAYCNRVYYNWGSVTYDYSLQVWNGYNWVGSTC